MKTVYLLCICILGLAAGALDNAGTEFILTFMDNKETSHRNINPEIFIATAKKHPVHVTVSSPGLKTDHLLNNFTVTNGNVHIVTIPSLYRLNHTEISKKGILIKADDEITVYGVNREPHSDDAYLALPTDTLGTEYYTISYSPSYHYCVFAIIGVHNETHVSIRLPNIKHMNVTVKGHTYHRHDWINVTLNRYSTFEVHSVTDLTGTHILSDKPIGVLSGNKKTVVGNTGTSRDHLVEMLAPVSAWGKNFATTPIPERTTGDIFRFVSSQRNTHINVTGIINGKQFHDHIFIHGKGHYVQKDYDSALYSHVQADKPISLFQFSKTQEKGSKEMDDPSMIMIPPIEQYAADYTFTTPAYSKGNYTNYFTFIVDKTKKHGMRLDNKHLPAHQHYTHIPGTTLVAGIIKISVGTHSVSHIQPNTVIGGILFGKANRESYGFPAGLMLSPINKGNQCNAKAMEYGDETDNDCDGQVDEEDCDGKDNDGDGRVDEDCRCCAPNIILGKRS